MTKFTAFVIIVALRLIYQPSYAQQGMSPFTSPSTATTIVPVKSISFTEEQQNNRMSLLKPADENEPAEQFKIKRCTDRKRLIYKEPTLIRNELKSVNTGFVIIKR